MGDGIYSALSGAVAQARTLDVVANNVANTGTTGFRADRVSFQEELSRSENGSSSPEQLRFVSISDVVMDPTPGALQQTGNALDMALEGEGWFAVETPQGERFTRAGAFAQGADGMLVTQQGFPVIADGTDGRIRIPPEVQELIVQRDGTILADGETLGSLRLRRFEPDALEKEGASLVRAEGAGTAAEAEVIQGYLEQSNMNAVAGLNEMINASRSFEAFQKIIRTYRQLDDRIARELGRSR